MQQLERPKRRVETERPVVGGNLIGFLRGSFLSEYVDELREVDPDFIELPTLIADTLLDQASCEFDGQPIIEELYLTSSVARAIAYKHAFNKEGMRDFWKIHDYMLSLQKKLLTSPYTEVREFAPIISDTPIDIDTKAIMREGTSLAQVFHFFAEKHHVSPDDITTEEFTDERSGTTNKRMFFEVNKGPFIIQYVVGAIPTNVLIDRLLVRITSAQDHTNIFDITLTTPVSKQTSGSYKDKRAGSTSDKQDYCVAKLYKSGDKIFYDMSKTAIETMKNQDSINIEQIEAGPLLEVFFRALRMNLLHPIEGVTLPQGKFFELPNLRLFFPLLTGQSLFSLRNKIREMATHGHDALPYENPKMMHLLQKELALCLIIDPYVTVQALRDSGIQLLIPGLRGQTEYDWEKIIRSQAFVTAHTSGLALPRQYERSLEFMASQRETYIGVGQKSRLFDGTLRFMQALGAKEGEEWPAYLDLWGSPSDQKGVAILPDKTMPSGHSIIRLEGDVYIGVPASRQIQTLYDFNRLGKEIMRTIAYQEDLPDRLEGWKKKFEEKKTIPILEHLFGKLNGSSVDTEEKEKAGNLLNGMALIYDMLARSPFGLTPEELAKGYYETNATFDKPAFSRCLFNLKRTGIVLRRQTERITTRSHNLVSVDFYSLYESDNPQSSIEDVIFRERFFDILEQVLISEKRSFNRHNLKDEVEKVYNWLNSVHVTSLEALESLSNTDFAVMDPREEITPSARTMKERIFDLRDAFRWYYLREYEQRGAVPPLYTDGIFDSPRGMEMRHNLNSFFAAIKRRHSNLSV
jgi:hypothetical protein